MTGTLFDIGDYEGRKKIGCHESNEKVLPTGYRLHFIPTELLLERIFLSSVVALKRDPQASTLAWDHGTNRQ